MAAYITFMVITFIVGAIGSVAYLCTYYDATHGTSMWRPKWTVKDKKNLRIFLAVAVLCWAWPVILLALAWRGIKFVWEAAV